MDKKAKNRRTSTKPPAALRAMSEASIDIGAMIKAHRKLRRWTLVYLAELTGIDQGNLSKIERDKQSLTNESMQALAQAFGLDLPELFQHPDNATELEHGIIAARKIPGAGRCRSVKFFKSLKLIPNGENVLVDGVKVIPNAGQGEKRWERDEETQYEIPGAALRQLESDPQDILAHVAGDNTMTPRIYQGDCLVMDTADTTVPSNGGVFGVVFENQPVEFRRLFPKPGNGLTVTCDNHQFPSMNLTANEREYVSIVGRVKAMYTVTGF
jgi:transcriptional regulator with XRE-family HTH domain